MKQKDSFVRPYIEDQKLDKLYSLSNALKYGTIFPELNLLDSDIYNKKLYANPKKIRGGKKHER